ncbi:MAG: ABC transporter permease, partial [Bacilli bacterium]|nr:ABC transporter permease [Bacilli bacterium]
FISFGLVFLLMLINGIPLSLQILNFIPLVILLVLITFGFSSILLHFGVFVEDLTNIISITLKLVFYLSGIFFSISTRVPEPYNRILLNLNPIALIIDSFRKILLYNKFPNYSVLTIWLVVGIFFSVLGLKTIYKYENSYVKVIK